MAATIPRSPSCLQWQTLVETFLSCERFNAFAPSRPRLQGTRTRGAPCWAWQLNIGSKLSDWSVSSSQGLSIASHVTRQLRFAQIKQREGP